MDDYELCAGCRVAKPWEHRCHGDDVCECQECNGPVTYICACGLERHTFGPCPKCDRLSAV